MSPGCPPAWLPESRDGGPGEPEVPGDLRGDVALVVRGLREAERVGAKIPCAARGPSRRPRLGRSPARRSGRPHTRPRRPTAGGRPRAAPRRTRCRSQPLRGGRDAPTPVSTSRHPVPLDDDHLTRSDLAHLDERGLGRREVPEADVAAQRAPVRREPQGGIDAGAPRSRSRSGPARPHGGRRAGRSPARSRARTSRP